MEPIRARLLHAPSLGRLRFEPELREMSAKLQYERRLVRSMLQRRTGGARTVERGVRRNPTSVDGTLRKVKGELRYIEPELAALRTVIGNRRLAGGDWTDLLPLRRDADELLFRIKLARRWIAVAERGFERWWWDRPMAQHRDMPPGYRKRLLALHTLRHKLTALERQARRASKARPRRQPKPKPPARKWREWTPDAAREAMDTWAAVHGRRPSARDLTDPALPSWGSVRKLFGGLPS